MTLVSVLDVLLSSSLLVVSASLLVVMFVESELLFCWAAKEG